MSTPHNPHTATTGPDNSHSGSLRQLQCGKRGGGVWGALVAELVLGVVGGRGAWWWWCGRGLCVCVSSLHMTTTGSDTPHSAPPRQLQGGKRDGGVSGSLVAELGLGVVVAVVA